MDPARVAQFWTIGVLLTLTPGADWAYVIGAGLRARSVAPSILGMLTAYALVIAAVAVGVGTLVMHYPVVLTVLTLGGAAYLLWLGLTTLMRRAEPVGPHGEPVVGSATSQFLRGAGVSGINPKGLLLLLALLPQFTSPTGMPAVAQMLVLGALQLADIAVIYTIVGLLARRLLRSRPRALVLVGKLSGAMMTLIGASLLVERFLAG